MSAVCRYYRISDGYIFFSKGEVKSGSFNKIFDKTSKNPTQLSGVALSHICPCQTRSHFLETLFGSGEGWRSVRLIRLRVEINTLCIWTYPQYQLKSGKQYRGKRKRESSYTHQHTGLLAV